MEIVVLIMTKSCPSCGVALKTSDIFCPFCGTSISSSHSPSKSSFSDSEFSDQFASSTPSTEESYSYGSGSSGYYTENVEGTRKWYQPPKRKRSAKHPIEWFFWIGWGLYIVLRIVFYILIIAAQVAIRKK